MSPARCYFVAGIKAKLKDKRLDKEAQKFYQKAEDELEKAHDYDFADPARFPYEEKFLQYMQKARESKGTLSWITEKKNMLATVKQIPLAISLSTALLDLPVV